MSGESGPTTNSAASGESGPAANDECAMSDGVARVEFMKQSLEDLRRASTRRVAVPLHKLGALKKNWEELSKPVIEETKLAIQFNPKTRKINIMPAWLLATNTTTTNTNANTNADAGANTPASGTGGGCLPTHPHSGCVGSERTLVGSPVEPPSEAEQRQLETYAGKCEDYFKAFCAGFKPKDALAVLRLEDCFVQSFQITEVRKLERGNLSRAIGRIAGKNGRTLDALQNSTRTRILMHDKTITILGASDNVRLARDAVCSLVIGAAPNRVHTHLGVVNRRMRERT